MAGERERERDILRRGQFLSLSLLRIRCCIVQSVFLQFSQVVCVWVFFFMCLFVCAAGCDRAFGQHQRIYPYRTGVVIIFPDFPITVCPYKQTASVVSTVFHSELLARSLTEPVCHQVTFRHLMTNTLTD